jgi:CHAT domain-containing protein
VCHCIIVDDGLLTIAKILDLKINADLVVLSACDTGQGTLTGDGVVGLSRSLISAGTPSVIVTLWKIPDIATSALMTRANASCQQEPLNVNKPHSNRISVGLLTKF